MIYPIGSVVFRYDDQSPATFLGGVWSTLSTENLKLVTHNPNYVNIGTYAETLTIDQMPSHNHNSESGSSTESYSDDNKEDRYLMANEDSQIYVNKTFSTGNNGAHNNIPTYTIVRAWERTG